MSPADWKGPHGTRRRVRALARRLEREYGAVELRNRRDPVDGLIMTVLSQATNDRNSLGAFERLKARFPTWDEALAAPVAEVEEAIRPAGLSRNKSRTIQRILAILDARPEGFNIDGLADLPLEQALGELTALPGVGNKTASCVLLFCFDRPAMPVDTHVHRLSRRLGLVSEKATPDQAHQVLQALTPPELVLGVHVGLIRHGRNLCRARATACGECVLATLCPSRSA